MSSNIDQFENKINGYSEQVVKWFLVFHRRLALEALKEVGTDSRDVGLEHGSPVWTGRFRGSHNLTVDAPQGKNLPPHPETDEGLRWPDEPESPYGAPALAKASAILNTALRPFSKVFITNSLPYARKIEAGGFSLKAPAGVYNITAHRLGVRYKKTTLKMLGIKRT